MTIEEKINQINKQIQDLVVQKQELIEQLNTPSINNKIWGDICEELNHDYYYYEDEFLSVNIESTTVTQNIFTRFLASEKKYLVLEDFFKIPYEYATSSETTKREFVFSSLVLIKQWGKLPRKKTTITISELKKFSRQIFDCLKNQKDSLKRLYYEIEDIQCELESTLGSMGEHLETIYPLKNPFPIYAQDTGMSYGKTREFIISGIIVKEVGLL